MLVYAFDPNNGEFLGNQQAVESPLEPGAYLIPGGCVETPPPPALAGHARCCVNGVWQQVPDHRGETWYDEDGESIVVDFIDDPATHGLSDSPPPPRELTVDEKIALLDAQLAEKMRHFNSEFIEASFANGSNENARIAELRLERDQAMTEYADAVLALIMEQ